MPPGISSTSDGSHRHHRLGSKNENDKLVGIIQAESWHVSHQIGLPIVGGEAFVDAPPKVLFRFSIPPKDGNARFGQCRSDSVLRRVDVA